MKKTAFILMFLTGLTTILGFIREIVLSYYYGASYITDAYLISQLIPQTIIAFIGAAIASIYIPLYSEIEQETSVKRADVFTSNIINFLFIISSAIALFVLVFTPYFVKIFAIGFVGETFDLTVKFTRISILSIFLSCLIFVFSSYLQLKNKFVATGLMTIPLNVIIIFSLFLSAKYNIYFLSIGSAIGVVFQLLFIIPFIKSTGFKYVFVLDKKDKYLKKMLSLSLPVMLGVSVYQINTIIDKTIASQILTGSVSILSYANKVNALVFGIFAVPIATALYPMISKMGAQKKLKDLNKTVSEAFINIMLLIIPITIGTIVLAEPIIRLIYGRGAFGDEAITMTASALLFYSIGMLAVGLREVLYRTFYSLQDTKTPLYNAAIAMVLNIILNIILSRFLGLNGIALATSISAILCCFLLLVNLRKKIGSLPIRRLSIIFVKVSLASIIMGFITIHFYGILIANFHLYFSVFLSIFVGVGIYFFIIKIMKIKELDEVLLQLKKKVKKFRKN